MVGPPTFFVGLMQRRPGSRPSACESLRLVSSGGAGVTPAFVDEATERARRAREAHVRVDRGADDHDEQTATSLVRGTRDRRPGDRRRAAARQRPRRAAAACRRARPASSGSGVPSCSSGYIDADADARGGDRAGWFRTGDLATVDDDGWLTIVGRIKDVIIRGGENISAAEVEGVLEAHPAVRQAVAVGYPDERLGERVVRVRRRGRPVRPRGVPGVVRRRAASRASRPPSVSCRSTTSRRSARASPTVPPSGASLPGLSVGLDHALAGLDASAAAARRGGRGGTTRRRAQLVELRALQEEVEVVLPREADAAVHLERRRHHPLRRVGRPRSSPSTRRPTPRGRRRRCTTRPSTTVERMPSTSTSMSAQRCFTAWKLPIGRPNCTRSFAYSTAMSSTRRRATEHLGRTRTPRPGRAARRPASAPPSRYGRRARRSRSQPSSRVRSIAGSAAGRPIVVEVDARTAPGRRRSAATTSASAADGAYDVGSGRPESVQPPPAPRAVTALGRALHATHAPTSPADQALRPRRRRRPRRARRARARSGRTAPARRGGRSPRAAPRARPCRSPSPPALLGERDPEPALLDHRGPERRRS